MLKLSSVRGFSLLEVLIAILLTAFGLLGLAGLMSRMQVTETEGYARSQAMSLLWNMSERLTAAAPTSTTAANAYTTGTGSPVGTGVTDVANDCNGNNGMAKRDLCEWSMALKGASETRNSGSTNVGAMAGARGCVEQLIVPNNASGTCTPATFRVSVAWQGLIDSATPTSTGNPLTSAECGKNSYTRESLRRIVSQQITIGMPFCTL